MSLSEVVDHMKVGHCIALTSDNVLLATGGTDGVLCIRKITGSSLTHGTSICQSKHDAFKGGISRLCISKDNSYVFTAGYDGTIFMFGLLGSRIQNQPFVVQ